MQRDQRVVPGASRQIHPLVSIDPERTQRGKVGGGVVRAAVHVVVRVVIRVFIRVFIFTGICPHATF